MLRRILFLFALCCASAVFAQVEPCATMKIYNEKLQKKEVESVEHFERWLAIKIQEGKAKGNGKDRIVITIPYVVHVINNGEALGTLSNISNTQINDQIAALNRDLRKANPDLANLPAAFQPLAADFEIEFCPAQIDPQGNILAEPGVNRVNRLTQGWTAPPHSDTYIDGTIKPATIWNPSNYFNMWVTQLGSGLLGYATFPGTTLLQGLNFPQYVGTATSDGIVVHYETFGNGNPGLLTNYTKGRVAVHEVGHWLGLRHIWGDASCGTDYCNDTPTHGGSNFGCPTYPSISCGNNGDLSQNYMDYTNDDCKLMFSNDQKIRAVTIMNNSPFRLSLQTSSACSLPGLNVGVTNIVAPCTNGTSQTVTVTIKNKGITAIAAGDVSVNLTVSGGITGTYGAVMNTASLSTNGSTTLTFTNVDLSTTADIVLTAEATLVGDLYAPDDTYNVSTNLGSPLITSVITATCPTVPFTISLTNPKPTATSTEWQVSANNVTFTTIANVTTNSLTTSQTDTMYYRCKTICGGNTYFSNVLQIDIDAPNNCYCTPSYSNGCGSGDAITNVTVSNLSNTTACAAGAPYYTFYNNTTIPIVDRNQPNNYSISFGPDGNQYFAIWIDQNVDGVFSASEMVAQNTVNAGSNGTYTGTFSLPTGTYVGQTRMRVRGGDDSALSATQSCGTSNSGWGETEDYLVEIIAPAFNVGVTAINPPCVGAANQNVGVILKNKGASSIPIGAVTLDLNFSGGANGSATTISNTTLIPVNGTFTLTFTNVNLTTTGGNIVFDVNATLAGDGNLLDNVLSLSTDLDDPNISTATVLACSATAFSINLTNPKATTTAMQWEKSLNNVTFSAIAGATTNTLSTSQTATTYYRCRITCSGSFYYSNVLQIDMDIPTNCYCTPTYTSGCSNGAAAITNVTVGNLSNPTTCSASPYFTFYNFLTVPQIDRYQPTPYSISLGSTSNQYFAIWIDQNADGIFDAAEMVAQNTVSIGSNGTYTGSFDIPVGTYVGQTRMRVRGGDLSMLSASQSCGTSNSNNGETEDYLIELITLPVNVAVTAIQLPCVGSTNQTVNVTIKNRGTTTIPIGAVALDLSFSGAANGTATTINNTTTIPTNGTATLSLTNLNLTTTGGNIAFNANATLVNDGNASDNILSLISDLDAPIISSAITTVCSGVPFDVAITNPKPTTTAIQWEQSLNNITFSPIAAATANILTINQTASTYYRCKITCSGSFYYSNVLQIDMSAPTGCYCTPTYSSGCGSGGGDAMTNVSVGTLNNPSGCPANPYYTFYNTLAIPVIDRTQTTSYSISFGVDPNQYFAIWIDQNVDGIFDAAEMVAQNTVNAGSNGTYTGTFVLPSTGYVGQTRMRVRGGNDSQLSATQSCGTSSSSWGETEDYLIDITAPAINVAVSSITKPCIASASQAVEVIIQNKGTADIPIGNLSLDLNLSGGVSGTYSATNTSLIPALSTAAVAIPNVNLNTNADVTFDVNAVIQGDSDPSDNTATTTTNLSLPVISTATIDACSGTPFTLSLTNNRPTFSVIQWEVSLNNVTFNNISAGNFINVNATQTATSYYRCKVVCGGNSYTSNVIQVGMAAPLTCYCTPTYTSGCNFGNSINNVTIGTLDNTTGCTNTYPYYTYYNNVTVPSLDRYQSIDYSVNFGNVNRYYAIWIDLNQDAVFTFNEMVANNTTVNNSSIYYGTFNLPAGTLLGQTRMRIRGGDQSVISANQSCGNSNSAFGETEDYIVNITEVPVNIGVNNITLPCTGATNQTVTVLVKNKGANPVPVGNLAIDLQVAGGITGTYTASNTSIIPVAGTSSVTITNVNLNTNADITVTANATIVGDVNLTDNTFNLATNIATPVISANNSGACSGVYFILSLTNARPSFSSLQWESSSNNVTFTNIVGATTASLNTLQTALTYYRCKVTCGTSVYYSNTLTMSMLPVNSCYCTPTYSVGCNFGDEITNVTYGTMTNASSCSPTAYSYFNTLPVPTIVRGAAKNFSISFGSDASNYFAVWIDMNHDGVFATTEMYLNNTTPIGANGTYNGTITVPLGTYVGPTRMRIRGGNNAIVLNTQPCAASSSVYGETEDYMINLESPCTTPAIGTVNTITDVSARTPLGCIGCTGPYLIEYGAAGFTPGIGTTPGVGGSIFTTPVLNQTLTGLQPGITYDVYARQACSNNSAKKTFTTTCNSNTLPYNDGFNVGVLSSCWQNNVITAGTVAPTLTVVPTSTFPTTNAVEGTHMIKFNSHFATAGAQSRLVSKVLNTTGVNKVDVSFQMYEDNELISAEDKVKVQYSLNGTTWTDVEELIRPNAGLATGNWYNRTFTLPTAAGNVTTLRIGLLFTSALGNNIYIDNFKAYASPIFANFNADTCATIVVHNVSGKNNFRFRNANSLVAEINPNGNNLGTVTLLMKENLAGSVNVPNVNSGTKYLPRYFDLKSNATTPFPQNATLRFLFHDDELTDLNAATNGNETINSLLIKKYKEPNGGSSSENCITSDNILPSVTVSGVVATAVPEGFMLAIQANEFGEFGGFPNTVLAPKIQAKVLLNNADVTSGIMIPGLPIVPNFPLSDPYSVAPWNTVFTHVAAGPTAATTSTVLNVTGNNAIIDWVFLELRTGFSGASTVAYTRAALLQADGDVVDTDGTSVVAFPNAVAGNYFVAIRHRNHLGFRTENPIAVSATTPMLDFTNGSQVLYGISPLIALSATLNAMNGGDANMDGSIDSSDSTIWELQNGSFDDYLFNSDYNADGSVDGSDSAIWELNNGKYQELD